MFVNEAVAKGSKMEAAIKQLMSETKNGVKLHSAVRCSLYSREHRSARITSCSFV